MDFQIQNSRIPAPRFSPDSNVSGIPYASPVLPDSLVAQGFTTMPDDLQVVSFGGQNGGEQDANQNTGAGTSPFSITINGAGADTSGGTIIPASSFTIGCTSGNFTITRAGIEAGGTSPQTLGPEELSLNTGFSGDFTIGDGFKDFIVFGVVVFSKNAAGKANAIVNSGNGYNTKIYVRDAEDSTPKFIEGISDQGTANPIFMFRIGTVRSTKSGALRRVYVTQSVAGDENAGDGLQADASSLAGIEIIWADQSITFIEAATLTAGHTTEAYWSLVLTVSSGSFDKTLTYDATPDIFTTTGTAPSLVQTKYRFRLITQYTNGSGDVVSAPISAYGQYREVKICINGIGYQTLMKVT